MSYGTWNFKSWVIGNGKMLTNLKFHMPSKAFITWQQNDFFFSKSQFKKYLQWVLTWILYIHVFFSAPMAGISLRKIKYIAECAFIKVWKRGFINQQSKSMSNSKQSNSRLIAQI